MLRTHCQQECHLWFKKRLHIYIYKLRTNVLLKLFGLSLRPYLYIILQFFLFVSFLSFLFNTLFQSYLHLLPCRLPVNLIPIFLSCKKVSWMKLVFKLLVTLNRSVTNSSIFLRCIIIDVPLSNKAMKLEVHWKIASITNR